MIICIAGYQGGVGKTTSAVHIAAYLQTKAPTLLLDRDETRSATTWEQCGSRFPFRIVDEMQAAHLARDFVHCVIDTWARPKKEELKALTEACDLLILPIIPNNLDTHNLAPSLQALGELDSNRYRVLLTNVYPESAGSQLRAELTSQGIPIFGVDIPRLSVFRKAASTGVCVRDVNSLHASRAWNAYVAIAEEVLNFGKTE